MSKEILLTVMVAPNADFNDAFMNYSEFMAYGQKWIEQAFEGREGIHAAHLMNVEVTDER